MPLKTSITAGLAALAFAAIPAADALAVFPGNDGVVVYSTLTGDPRDPAPLKVVDLDGKGDHVIADGHWHDPQVSPDGKKIVATRGDEDQEGIWVMDVDGGNPRAVVLSTYVFDPVWSPDSRHIAFRKVPRWLGEEKRPPTELRVIAEDGSGERKLDANELSVEGLWEWAPDGSEILAYAGGPVLVDPNGGEPRPASGNAGYFSPNGKEIYQPASHGADLIDRDGSNRRAIARNMPAGLGFERPSPSNELLTWVEDDEVDSLWISDASGGNVRRVGSIDVSGGFDIQPIPRPASDPVPVEDPAPVDPTQPPPPPPPPGDGGLENRCKRTSRVQVKLKVRRGAKLTALRATVSGRRARAIGGRAGAVTVVLPKGATGALTVKVTGKAGRRTVRATTSLNRCK